MSDRATGFVQGTITDLCLSTFRAELRVSDGSTIAFGGRAEWWTRDVAHLMIEERPREAGQLAAMLGLHVSATFAEQSGSLWVATSAGRLHVPADARYEAWEIVGPGTRRLVCLPGGEVAVWE